MTIVAHDPYPDEDAATNLEVQFRDLPELLAAADIISLNCGLSIDNKHLVDKRRVSGSAHVKIHRTQQCHSHAACCVLF